MLVFFGDYEKHDFVITTAIALSTLSSTHYTIVSDDMKNYKYFEGEVNDVSIAVPGQQIEGNVIYDCHKTLLYEGEDRKLILSTNYTKPSVELCRNMFNKVKVDALLICEQDSSISRKYLDTYVGGLPTYTYDDSSRRRIDMVYDEKMKFKGIEESFLKSVGSFIVDQQGVDAKDVKSLWSYLKRRG